MTKIGRLFMFGGFLGWTIAAIVCGVFGKWQEKADLLSVSCVACGIVALLYAVVLVIGED